MATLDKEFALRKKPITYGKATRKRISNPSFDPACHESTSKQATRTEQISGALPLSELRLASASNEISDETKTTVKSSRDIFDFPSDGDDNHHEQDRLKKIHIQLRTLKKGGLFTPSHNKLREANNVPSDSKTPRLLKGKVGESSNSNQPLQVSSSLDASSVPVRFSKVSENFASSSDLPYLQPSQQRIEKKPSSTLKLNVPKNDSFTPKPKRKLPISPKKPILYKPETEFPKTFKLDNAGIYDFPPSDKETKLSTPPLQRRSNSSSQKSNKLDCDTSLKASGRSNKKFKSSPASEPSHSPSPRISRVLSRSKSRSAIDSNSKTLKSLEKKSPQLLREISSEKKSSLLDLCEVKSLSSSETSKLEQLIPIEDVEMADLVPKKERLTKSQKILKDLLASAEGWNRRFVSCDKYTQNRHSSSTENFDPSLYRSGESTKLDTINSRRPRLIDSLVRQASNTISFDNDDSEDSTSDLDLPQNLCSGYASSHVSSSESLPNEQTNTQLVISESQSSSQGIGPKFTYSRQRSMLAEEDLMKELALELPAVAQTSGKRKNRRGSIPELNPISNFHDEDDENSQVVIKSVHELRKSGANKRFIDECIDFLDRIGFPDEENNSARRSSLLELASKMRQKNFAQQFRANSMEQQFFIHLGKETDVISGFLITSILISVFMEGAVPHIINHLCKQGMMKLIVLLVECDSSIIAVSQDRKSNMSKISQQLLIEQHDLLIQSNMWEELRPKFLSPRTIALKCLDMMVRQIREAENFCNIFPEELNTKLFTIMNTASDEESWNFPENKKAIDFCLAVAVLQTHSVAAYTLDEDAIWFSHHLPKLADVLEISLSHPHELFEVQFQILKLTLQVTNDNQIASEIFARPSLIFTLCQNMIAQFQIIHSVLSEEKFKTTIDYLSLLLGILMNFSEWSSGMRECLQNFQHQDEDPLEEMLHIFKERSAGITQAESEQETLKNVVLSYLAVTLGFLSQHPCILERIAPQEKVLVSCIEEFISIHRLADRNLVDSADQSTGRLTEEDAHLEAQRELTERLERLVRRLKCTSKDASVIQTNKRY